MELVLDLLSWPTTLPSVTDEHAGASNLTGLAASTYRLRQRTDDGLLHAVSARPHRPHPRRLLLVLSIMHPSAPASSRE